MNKKIRKKYYIGLLFDEISNNRKRLKSSNKQFLMKTNFWETAGLGGKISVFGTALTLQY